MQKSKWLSLALVICISCIFLYLIGLLPYRAIISGSAPDLAGAFAEMFSWGVWFLGFLASLLCYLLLENIFTKRLVSLTNTMILISLAINIVGMFPATIYANKFRKVFTDHEKYIQNVVRPTVEITNLTISKNGSCTYSINVTNHDNKTYQLTSIDHGVYFKDSSNSNIFTICGLSNSSHLVSLSPGLNTFENLSGGEPTLYNPQTSITSIPGSQLVERIVIEIEKTLIVIEVPVEQKYKSDILSRINTWSLSR